MTAPGRSFDLFFQSWFSSATLAGSLRTIISFAGISFQVIKLAPVQFSWFGLTWEGLLNPPEPRPGQFSPRPCPNHVRSTTGCKCRFGRTGRFVALENSGRMLKLSVPLARIEFDFSALSAIVAKIYRRRTPFCVQAPHGVDKFPANRANHRHTVTASQASRFMPTQVPDAGVAQTSRRRRRTKWPVVRVTITQKMSLSDIPDSSSESKTRPINRRRPS